ncbi:hypothetical protein EMPS_10120 [Entomortierella parvispora]|uniref:PQ loop repeat protein n=1 Tax=Entomortierella parvispora TaxID=205924 RepID=A0A9P3HJI0_9FUNG|nr:hypothetical protein EMPS_10120 [Entomortierella parvispora]
MSDYLNAAPYECPQRRRTGELVLSVVVLFGLLISYVPQVYRIIHKKNSDGFSPWFLLLGCLSATSSFLNLLILQWPVVRCCKTVSAGLCLENTLGIGQLGVQFIMFNVLFILYTVYFPPHKKVNAFVHNLHLICLPSRSFEWALTLLFGKIILGHLLVCTTMTAVLLAALGRGDQQGSASHWILVLWAGLLGILNVLLALIQYLPQLIETYLRKSVGALSIPWMLIQTPSTILLTVSIALRPTANWTSWIVYAVSAIFQSILLGQCIHYRYRAKKLGYSSFTVAERTPLLHASPDNTPARRTGNQL